MNSELTESNRRHTVGGIIRNETFMSTERTEKNIALVPELLKRVEDLAGTDRTPDEIANEAVQKYVDAQEVILGLRSFVARNRKDMDTHGVKESDIATEIAADRKERRR
jgi:hypothetical protein